MPDFLVTLLSARLSLPAALMRIGAAFAVSALIGLERELRRQSAGLRTHILIGLGSCLLMLLSIWLPTVLGGGDPGRIAAQVVSGIGFLGAGAVIRFGTDIKGVTTSASIWATAAIGLCLGAGMWIPALVVAGLAVLTLGLLEVLERRVILEGVKVKSLELTFRGLDANHAPAQAILRRRRLAIRSLNADYDVEKGRSRLGFVVEIPSKVDFAALMAELRSLPELTRVTVDEKL
jgi:putative Mg2+ transporter-C (MgtC) family protein